jgi:two-component system sensor histidine kinase VicK
VDSSNNDLFYQSQEFQTFFKRSARSLVLKANDPHFTILAVSDTYLHLVHAKRDEILNKGLFEAFPGSAEDPTERDRVLEAFALVINTKEILIGNVFTYEIFNADNGIHEQHYWKNIDEPVLDEEGNVAYIINTTTNITVEIKQQKTIKEQEQQLTQIINMLPAHVVIIRGYDLVVESINEANLAYWCRTKEQVIGKRFLDILPDLADQPFASQLRRVMETGEIIDVKESPVIFVMEDGSHRETYVDYKYQPLTNSNGKHTGVLVMSSEITDRVTAKKLLESYASELQLVNDQLTASNLELASSEARFKYLIKEAPVAIGVLAGRELIIETSNQKLLDVWGKPKSIIGLPLAKALPEIQGQPFLGILDTVFTSGKPFYANEIRAALEHQGTLNELFFNLVYQPIQGPDQKTTDILVVAVDVTEQVNARKKVEQAELTLRLAVEGANVGTFVLDARTRKLTASARFKQLYGFDAADDPALDDFMDLVNLDYKSQVEKIINDALQTGLNCDISYTILSYGDNKPRWLRILGNTTQNGFGANEAFTGVLMDITEQKQDEQRKNDFIGMVSHELKTPLTSLNGYLQMLGKKAKDTHDEFTSNALDRSIIQVRKMTTMINGFLNVSRLESGKIHIDKQNFDLAELVKEAEEETIVTISSHHVIFAPVEETFIVGDRDKIGQVINNFISNAVKYSPHGSTIQVACTTVQNTALVSVKDEGMGVKPEDQQRLFERYYRVEAMSNQTISGFGIGLYLCSEIINRHDGKIWVDSEPGNGSTFYFSLPVKI